MIDLDDALSDLDEIEERESGGAGSRMPEAPIETMRDEGDGEDDKGFIGTVEKYFSKLDVAAITLKGHLRLGDTIGIRDKNGEVRETVSSMQIDRKDVQEAFKGDDVGIKLANPVAEGSRVYRLPRA